MEESLSDCEPGRICEQNGGTENQTGKPLGALGSLGGGPDKKRDNAVEQTSRKPAKTQGLEC